MKFLSIRVEHHLDPVAIELLERILHKLTRLELSTTRLEERMSKELDDLTAEVERNTSVEASAVTLIQGLAQQLQDALNNGDTAKLQDLTTKLSGSADALA